MSEQQMDPRKVRIGLALSDETQLLASPLETLVRRRGKRFPMPRFLELIRNQIDIVFANEREIRSLYQTPDFDSAREAARAGPSWPPATACARRSGRR